ncbi:SDR family oxidoreductase [Frankia sp. Cpl3]|nr:SDR family oxidoreductase [Frankia sp. Cpl3]
MRTDAVPVGTGVLGQPAAAGRVFDLSGRVAIVTGAAHGIGLGVSEVFAEAGATVVCADIDGDAAAAASRAITDAGGSAKPATVDVSRREQVRALVRSVVAEHGRLDVMCNNAGIIVEAPVLELSEEQFDRVLAVNLKGLLFGCQEAGAVMRGQQAGSIINMASAAADTAPPGLVAYSVSKAGAVQITRTLAKELGPEGVRVNAVAPGLVETTITRRHYTNQDGTINEDNRATFLARGRDVAPLRRIGTPADIGYAALYLASDASRFVTGQVLRPNGGTSMP